MPRFAFLGSLALLAAAFDASAAEQARTVAPFKSIDNAGPVRVVINVGQPQSLVVSGPDAYLQHLQTDVVDGTLRITLKDVSMRGSSDLVATIGVPSLARYAISGAGGTTINHATGDALVIDCSGAGSVKVDGNVRTLTLDVSGVGSIDARSLVAQTAHASVSGVGSVKVDATDTLVANLSGVGSLTYYGHPRNVTKNSSGVGSVSAGD